MTSKMTFDFFISGMYSNNAPPSAVAQSSQVIFQINRMTLQQNDDAKHPREQENNIKSNVTKESDHGESFTAGNSTPELATNDGSVIETLDTAFHGTPGWSEGENMSGSNRADYYEARSYGKSDVEEELDELRKNKPSDKNTE